MPAKATYQKVIVLGATGSPGSLAAQTAQRCGSHATLAVRDLEKPISGLTFAEEQNRNTRAFELTWQNPTRSKPPCRNPGATAAFVNIGRGSKHHMLTTWKALKEGNIELAVFLSSWTVPKTAEQQGKVEPSDPISYHHAKAELALSKVFDEEHRVCL